MFEKYRKIYWCFRDFGCVLCREIIIFIIYYWIFRYFSKTAIIRWKLKSKIVTWRNVSSYFLYISYTFFSEGVKDTVNVLPVRVVLRALQIIQIMRILGIRWFAHYFLNFICLVDFSCFWTLTLRIGQGIAKPQFGPSCGTTSKNI